MLKDEIEQFTKLTGRDGWHTSIGVIGAYLDGYERGLEETRPRAKWIHFDETKRFHEAWQCSNCYHDVIENPRYTNRVTGESLDFRFCPFCGAIMSDMREVKKREID